MNVLNRVLVVLAVLVALVVCVAVFVVPVPILQAAGEWLVDMADSLAALTGTAAVLRVVVGVLFAIAWIVICLLVLALELIPRRAKTVRVQRIDGGEVEVGLKTVEEHISYAVDQLPGILRVRSTVAANRGGVVVNVEVDTAGDDEVPDRANQVIELVRQVVEEKVGVKLAQPPRVRLHAQPAPKSGGRTSG